jgi:hypothetical protein
MPLGMPGWSGLLKSLVGLAESSNPNPETEQKLSMCRAGIDAGEFELVASLIRSLLHKSDIMEHVSDLYGDHNWKKASQAKRKNMERRLKCLLALPWRGIVTTNYDTLIEYGQNLYGRTRTQALLGSGSRLGVVLAQSQADTMFFVKIHGSINLDHVVLSTEEYNELYFKPHINRFLSALMMSYSILFIGSSLEDQLIQMRRTLTAEFEGNLPLAYAILFRSDKNVRRERWLCDIARIQPLFYDDPEHLGVDNYLMQLQIECDQVLNELPTSQGTARNFRSQDYDKRWSEIGEINRQIVYLTQSMGGSIRHRDLMELADGSRVPERIRDISSSERIYRILFLTSCGIVTETMDSGEKVYLLTSETQEFLETAGRS